MKKRFLVFCVALGPLLAGCWMSKTGFYDTATPLTPFKPGAVASRDGKGEVTHFTLSRDGAAYRLVERGAAGHDGFLLRFRALKDAPSGTLLFDAVSLENCKDGACDPPKADAPHMYGLARRTAAGVEEINPACSASIAGNLGVTLVDKFGTCEFTSPAALQKALLGAMGQKPDNIFQYE